MPVTKVRCRWTAGVQEFVDLSGNVIFSLDGPNRKLTIPSGSTLELASGSIATFADEILNGADVAIADGKILIGDAGGAGAAKTPSGDVTMTREGVTAIGAKKVLEGMIALTNHKVLIGDSGGAAAAMAVTGDVTISDAGVTAIGSAKVTSAMLASGAGVAALVTAGLGNSATYIKTDTGTKTLLAANSTKDRGVLVLVHIDETFATGDTSQLILKIGEADTIEKAAAAAVFTDAAAGANFVFGFVNTSTKAILATLTAAVGTGTGGASITVLALPNS